MEERKISELIKKYSISDTDRLVAEDEDGTKAVLFSAIKEATLKQLSCETVNKLKSLNASEGLLIHTLGYNKINDGGAGSYVIVYDPARSDDGGLCHYLKTSDTLRAELIHDGSINVKQFGAACDGVHDDYNAIQKAIDTGLDVVIPNGKYKITSSLKIHSNTVIDFNNSTIICPNSQAFIIGQDEKANNIVVKNAIIKGSGLVTITNNASNITIENISYSGDGYNMNTNAIHIASDKNITLDKCNVEYFNGKAVGAYIVSDTTDNSNTYTNLSIRDCQFLSNADNVIDINTTCSGNISISIIGTSITCKDIDHSCVELYGSNICNIDDCKFYGGKYNIYQNGGIVNLSNSVINNCGQLVKQSASFDTLILSGLVVFLNSENALPLMPANPGTVTINGIIKNNTNRSQK